MFSKNVWCISPCTGWRHTQPRHCSRCGTRRHIVPYLFIICLDYVLRTSIDLMKENGFKLEKERRRNPITDADYAEDIAILANTSTQAETLLHSLERAAGDIGFHVSADNTEYMCFKQRSDISTLKSRPLKLVDKFTYLGSSISSTETDINTQLPKGWTAIDRLSVTWKSDLIDKTKCSFFFEAMVVTIPIYGSTTWTLTKSMEKKVWRQLHKNAASNIEQVHEAIPEEKNASVRSPTTHHENYPS